MMSRPPLSGTDVKEGDVAEDDAPPLRLETKDSESIGVNELVLAPFMVPIVVLLGLAEDGPADEDAISKSYSRNGVVVDVVLVVVVS
jgi:hypothetical protein